MDFSYTIAGALTGFVVGLTGIGGGALMTPILLLVFGINPTVAVATDLWFATLTKISALGIHQKGKHVEWFIVRRLWLGSLPAALITTLTILYSGFKLDSKYLTAAIGIVIFITAIGLLLSHWLKDKNIEPKISDKHQKYSRWQGPLTVIAGAMLGVIVSLTSVGAGALGSIMLLYLYPVYLSPNKLVGTDIAHAIPLALVAGLGYLISGYVNLHLLVSLLCGSIPATILGSLVATNIAQSKLRVCLAAILSVTAFKLIFT